MTLSNAIKKVAACAIITGATSSFAHISLETRSAAAGSNYKAVLQVGHGCEGLATTALSVQIPAGFQGAKPYPKAGWKLALKNGKLAQPYDNHGKPVTHDVSAVSWTAVNKESALPDAYFDEFMLRGKVADNAGPLWFKVLQSCGNSSVKWDQIPGAGTSTQGLKLPAPLLEVTASTASPQGPSAAAGSPVQVSGAWVRATVPGQQGSGAFMKLTAPNATRLVGVSTPAAGIAEVHEMKMEGDIMKMRPVAALDLPAGKTVELKSGGYHVMLMDLKQPLLKDSMLPMTLRFKDAKGVESKLDVSVPVSLVAPSGGPGLKAGEQPAGQQTHRH